LVRRASVIDPTGSDGRFSVPIEMAFTVLAILLGIAIVVRAVIG
jgi:hypothetical protein